ncbi:hypothetical protein E2C01_048973 [Portunus trituberculatus]|uniref:Uncharacterized protein n=1 Tax=Portunus trituberculatus TaxID=210409 RepID=A0A5B7G7Z4_PORTR|nr:hypothetical protein [Portunus trituberculatus]
MTNGGAPLTTQSPGKAVARAKCGDFSGGGDGGEIVVRYEKLPFLASRRWWRWDGEWRAAVVVAVKQPSWWAGKTHHTGVVNLAMGGGALQ